MKKAPRHRAAVRLQRHAPRWPILVLAALILIGITVLLIAIRDERRAVVGQASFPAPAIGFEVPTGSVFVGDTVTIGIRVSNVMNLMAAYPAMVFEPNVLAYQGSAMGPFLVGNPPVAIRFFPLQVQSAGRLWNGEALRQSSEGVSGSGVVYTVTFTAVAPGTSTLSAEESKLYDRSWGEIPAASSSNQLTVLARQGTCTDADGDGFGNGCALGPDCNDGNPQQHPGVTEICGNGIDENCDYQDPFCQRPPPTVSIASPATGATLSPGTVTFQGSAQDGSGNPISGANLFWELDGDSLGYGSPLTAVLAAGTHQVRLTATDDRDESGSAVRTFTIAAPQSQNQTNQSTATPTAESIGLRYRNLAPLTSRYTMNLSYNVTNASVLSSCTFILDNAIVVGEQGARTFSFSLLSYGSHTGKISCQTVAGRTIELPPIALYYIRMGKFGGSSSNLSNASNASSVSNFQLEQVGLGRVQFSQPVDLSQIPDLDEVVSFTENSITVDTGRAPGLNRPARVTLLQVNVKNPRILRDGQPCNACPIRSFARPMLTFDVPGFSTYRVEEVPSTPSSTTPSAPSSQTPAAPAPAPQPAPTSTTPASACAFSFFQGKKVLDITPNAVLCLSAGAEVSKFRLQQIETQVLLIQDTPSTRILTFTSAPLQLDLNGDGTPEVNLRLLSVQGTAITIELSSIAAPAPKPPAADASSPSAPKSVTQQPSAELGITASSLFWIAIGCIVGITVIVLIHHSLTRRAALREIMRPPERKEELNPKLDLELAALGISPKVARLKLEEKLRKR